MKQGIFGIPVKNPFTGAVYCEWRHSHIGHHALRRKPSSPQLPDPNLPGTSNNYQSAPADTIY